MEPILLPELHAFRGAFGRLCALAAQALVYGGQSREAVRIAFQGEGVNVNLAPVRLARKRSNERMEEAQNRLAVLGFARADATKLLLAEAKVARRAVEGEWDAIIPILVPHP